MISSALASKSFWLAGRRLGKDLVLQVSRGEAGPRVPRKSTRTEGAGGKSYM